MSTPKGSLERLEALVGRVRRRVNIQVGLERATTAATFGVMFAMVALVLWKTGWMAFGTFGWTVALFGIVTLGSFGSAWLADRDLVALAQQLDRSHNLHDRLSTALSLAREGAETEFAAAQMRDALDHLDSVDPGRAAPLRKPHDLGIFAAFAAGFLVLAVLKPPSHAHPLPEPPNIQHDPVLDEATVALERERVAEMKKQLEGTQDPETKELVDELDKLLDEVEEREISGREFLKRLDKLERKHFEQQQQQADDSLADELKRAAEELEKSAGDDLEKEPEMKEAIEAMKQKDLDKASKSLEKLAEKLLSKENMSKERMERLGEMFEKFADKMNVDSEKLRKKLSEQKELVDKLSEKFGQDGSLSQKEKRRLNREKKEADRMQKEFGVEGKTDKQRRLEQLRRKTEEAAENMKKAANQQNQQKSGEQKKNDPDYKNETGRQMKKASRQTREESQRQRSQEVEKMARKQMEQLRESMRRSRPQRAKQQSGQGSGSEKSGDRGEKMREFIRRAQGESNPDGSSEANKRSQQAKSGQQKGESSKKPSGKNGEGKQGEKSGGGDKQASKKPSNAAGDEPGGPAMGEKTSMESTRTDKQLQGRKGGGPSKSQVIRSASEKGFANTEYKKVYGDYSKVVEEVMNREDVPPGYRYYVKRYFELIKPRD